MNDLHFILLQNKNFVCKNKNCLLNKQVSFVEKEDHSIEIIEHIFQQTPSCYWKIQLQFAKPGVVFCIQETYFATINYGFLYTFFWLLNF